MEITINTPDEAGKLYKHIGDLYFAKASAKEIILLNSWNMIIIVNLEKYPKALFYRMLSLYPSFEDLRRLPNPKIILYSVLKMVYNNIGEFRSEVLVEYVNEFGKTYNNDVADLAYAIWKKYPDVSLEHIKFVDNNSERKELLNYLEKEFGSPRTMAFVCDDYVALNPSTYEDFSKANAKPRKFIICERKSTDCGKYMFIDKIHDSFECPVEEAKQRFLEFFEKNNYKDIYTGRLLDITNGYDNSDLTKTGFWTIHDDCGKIHCVKHW